MPPFNFTESFARTIAEFDNLPAASREDYFRMKEKRSSMTDTPTRKDKGKAMKPPADATHCGGYPTDTPTPDMTAPERYVATDLNPPMKPDPMGAWVYWDDYRALSAKLEAERAEKYEAGLLLSLHMKRAEAAEAERDAALGVLDGIAIYGADTLSGNARGPDNRAWQRAAVVEMTKRAQAARQKCS